MGKKKFYVVWNGVNPGIYDNWMDCQLQILGFSGAQYRSFDSFEAAREGFESGYEPRPQPARLPAKEEAKAAHPAVREDVSPPYVRESLAVDAACSGNPGDMEYRGVYVATGEEWFHIGPLKEGTNNVGEFLALVHGLAFMKKGNLHLPLYSDSLNAIKWVRIKSCRTMLKRTQHNAPIFDLIARAEKWLLENDCSTPVMKWNTAAWGEIPADFGRK
ncbi:MAG: ribonuclease H family protein [Tannerella sp.]|jgi:ribonuclease HI|nr:ribonuclease H family protein [Tannerella sp.]